jgi:polysaccharide biosynthesis transport protein
MAENKSPGTPPKSRQGPRGGATIDLRQPLIVLRAHLTVAVALAVVACTLAAWQMMRRPKLYMAGATLFLERGERLDLGERAEIGVGEVALLTRLEQMRSPEMLQRVVASLTSAERALVAPDARGAAPGMSDAATKSAVRGTISFDRRPNTTLIAIVAVHEHPEAAALLANRFAEQAIHYAFERSSASNDASLTFLRTQAEDIRKKAEEAERALQEYRQRFNLVSLEANQNIIVDNLKSLNASATAARVARVSVEAKLGQAEAVMKRGEDATQLASITGFSSLGDVARRLEELRGKRAVMAERYGRRHPAMLENEQAIEGMEKLRDEQIATAMASLRDQRDKALAEESQLGAQRAKAEKEALNLDQLGVEYNILRSAVDSHKASYTQILARLNDATISAQLRGVNLRISELATTPGAPFSPNPRKTLLITVGLAVVILLGYPFSAEMFFGRIRSAMDVEYHLGCDLLGEIGSVSRVSEKDRPLLVKSDNDEAAAEQFRALYGQLSLTSKIDPPKTILITSTLPGEGKSFIAANLAECFVAHGRRVLLVDADLRRPTQHRHFGLDNKAGLVRWLDEGGPVEGGLLENPKLGLAEVMPGLFLLRAGGLSRKASELMESGRLAALLTALQRRFDIMILDTPPAGVFPDAIGFARVCHELIYICRFNSVSRQSVRDVLQRMRQTELEFPGVVLNAMPSGFGGSYYYKGYSYQRAKYYTKRYQQPVE